MSQIKQGGIAHHLDKQVEFMSFNQITLWYSFSSFSTETMTIVFKHNKQWQRSNPVNVLCVCVKKMFDWFSTGFLLQAELFDNGKWIFQLWGTKHGRTAFVTHMTIKGKVKITSESSTWPNRPNFSRNRPTYESRDSEGWLQTSILKTTA